jgi:signal transduction histidine kinase
MKFFDLPRTGSFRTALIFLALFALSSAGQSVFLYMRTHQYLRDQADKWLARAATTAFVGTSANIAHRFDSRALVIRSLDHAFALYDGKGRRLAGDELPLPAHIAAFDQVFSFRARLPTGEASFRAIAHYLPDGDVALVARDMYEIDAFDEAFANIALWGGVLTVGLGVIGALIVAAGTVRRFDAVASAIHRIVRGDLTRRLPLHSPSSDLDRLAGVVNGMLDDIERLMQDIKGVCDGIAHDLRTPLTRMLAGLERARRRGGSAEECGVAIDEAIIETRSVLKTFSALLRIAEVEDGARRAGFKPVDLGLVVRDVIEFYEPLADERGVCLAFEQNGLLSAVMDGDSSLLFEAVGNLIDNAIKFTPAGGRIVAKVKHRSGNLVLSIADTGCGIARGEREAVLRRFHRAEQSRHTPGNGLGLSLVAAVARLHGMDLAIEDAAPGCRVVLACPAPAYNAAMAGPATSLAQLGVATS